jgi:hypothetical protein
MLDSRTSKKRKIAAEFLAELEANPECRAERDRREQQRGENHERILAAQRPLVQDLRAAGTRVESVWDLVNTRARYPAAIPVLLEHLEREYIPEAREGIARALAVPEATAPGRDCLSSSSVNRRDYDAT